MRAFCNEWGYAAATIQGRFALRLRDRVALEPLKVSKSGWIEAVPAMPDAPIRDERRFIAAARHAAQRAVNPARLIDGENIESPQPADARHWVSVYSELLAFKQRTLDHMYHDLQDLSSPANQEVRQIDVPLIEGEQLRYQRRLRYWQARARQPAYPAPFYSPFQSENEGDDGGHSQRLSPRVQMAPEPEQETPVFANKRYRRQYD